MNKKVLRTMIALVVIFLTGLYVLKIFFPEQFVLSIENKTLIAIGNYIDNNDWLYYLFGIFTSFITYWFYLCAVCRRWYLKWYEIIIVLLVIGSNIGLNFWDINIYSAFSILTFIVLPLLFGSDLKTVAICFSIHSISQILSLSIRNLPIYLQYINSLTLFMVAIECYFWLFLFYIYYNYKKEDSLWVGDVHHSTEIFLESKEKSTKSTKRLNLFKRIKIFLSQNLTKNNLRRLLKKIKLKLKIFLIYELWVYLIVIGSIALCSWIFNRWIGGIMFCIAHIILRNVFNKQFHFNVTAYCLILTLAIVWFAIPITLPMATSLLSSIPIAFLVCFFGFLAQDRVDLALEVKRLNKYVDELLSKIQHKDIYSMNEDELYEHCRSCGLSEEDCKIAYFVVIERLKGKELYKAIGYSERQTIRKRREILKTIK